MARWTEATERHVLDRVRRRRADHGGNTMTTHLLEEAPRDWPTLCADAADVIEQTAELMKPDELGDESFRVHKLAFQVERLARQVAEIAQRMAGDTV